VTELRKRGVRTVVVDPRFTPDAAKADVWLPIRAGSDAALFMSWINYIIENKLYDEEFVTKWTNGPLLVNPETKVLMREADVKEGGRADVNMCWDTKTNSLQPLPFPWDDNLEPELFGTHDVTLLNGKTVTCTTGIQALKDRVSEWTLDKAAETCWLEADKIEEAIKIYADGPSSLSLGVATDQYPQSSVNAMCCAMLEILMGNIEKPGVALQGFDMGPDSMAKPFWSRYTEEVLKKRFGAADKYHGLLAEQLSHIPSVWNAIMTGEPYSPHIWMEFSGNKLALLAEPQRWLEAFDKMDFVCHTYMYPTSFTVECADMILPTVEWLEIPMVKSAANRLIVRQPATHIYEGINMEYICSMIIARCAEKGDEDCMQAMTDIDGDRYWWNYDEYLDYIAGVANAATGRNQTWEELCEEGVQLWKSDEEYRHYYIYKEINPETGLPNGFTTNSGKCELYGESLVECGRTGKPFIQVCDMDPVEEDYDALPYFREPDESPSTDDEYPLVMSNGRIPFYHHGTLRNNPFMRELYPTPELWINPETAEGLNIGQGDWVNIKSRRSTGIVEDGIYARAKVTDGINPGEVYMERFWNPEYLENGDDPRKSWTTMNVNTLSNFESTYDPVFGTYTLRGYQVKVEKADGAPEGAWVEPKDFEPWMPAVADETEMVFE
jgi:anaerobic selenocysteine-containing dehydrogenase